MNPLVIGIAGGSGSGKTTVTKRILDSLDPKGVALLPHDAYYYDIERLHGMDPDEINFDHPDVLETSLLVSHLRQLRRSLPVDVPTYDFTTYHRKRETRRIEGADVIIVEGILIFVSRELRDLMDIKIFIDTDADERVIRRIKRDLIERKRSVDSIMDQYMKTVRPMHLEFVEPSKRWADVIIPRGVENVVAIDMVVTKIKSLLADREIGRNRTTRQSR